MLIIFDLDDTLIDTSGAVTPFKLQQTLKRLQEEGLVIEDEKQAYGDLERINQSCISSRQALKYFLGEKGALHLLPIALEEMTSPLPSGFRVPTTPYAIEILNYFSQKAPLALVTGGVPSFQQEKLEKAGIDSSIFSKIDIPKDSVKKPCYEGLIEQFNVSANQVFVCGDRISLDLQPGYELGLQTIHMRWGRGAQGPTDAWVHYVISDLRELKGIIR